MREKKIENEEFFSKLKPKFKKKGDCVLWIGSPRVQINNEKITPQRAVIYAYYKKTPVGPIKLICNNRNCVNLRHMLFERKFNPRNVLTPIAGASVDADMFVENKKLLDELDRITKHLGHQPNQDEWEENTDISARIPSFRFSTWQHFQNMPEIEAKKAEAEMLEAKRKSLNNEEFNRVATDLKRVKELLGRNPNEEDFLTHGRFSMLKVKKVFKSRSWEDVLKMVFNPKKNKSKSKSKDVDNTSTSNYPDEQ